MSILPPYKKISRLVLCSSFSLCCSITEKNDPKKPDILEIQEFDCSEDGKMVDIEQRCIKNPVKYLRWSALRE